MNDGSYVLPRSNPEDEKEMDKMFYRLRKNLWLNRRGAEFLNSLKGNYEKVYIVGSGKSIKKLKKVDFENPDVPIICTNEAVHFVENLELPNPIILIQVSTYHKHIEVAESTKVLCTKVVSKYYKKKYIVTAHQIGSFATAGQAALLLGRWVCSHTICLRGFDSLDKIPTYKNYADEYLEKYKKGRGYLLRYLDKRWKWIH